MEPETPNKTAIETARRWMRKIVFGETLLPQEFTIGLASPQTEIAVWLHGMGEPIDVTNRQSTACSAPFVVCVAFDERNAPSQRELKRLSLRFCERFGQKRVLGQIGLRFHSAGSSDALKPLFFTARSATNYCLPRARLCAHYLLHEYSSRKRVNTSGIEMSFLEKRAAIVTFIRPHPIVLVSARDQRGGNIFPMNLMGDLGQGRFGFGLKESRTAAPLVERAGRLALSSVPTRFAPLIFQFAAHHFQESIDFDGLPFPTARSKRLAIPVPAFALRVREMEVEQIHRLGSHTFFIARILSDETLANEEEICAIHGFYQAWRLKGQSSLLRESLERHSLHKRGPIPV